MTTVVKINVNDSVIADLLCSAWEGGSNYWARANNTPYTWTETNGNRGLLSLKDSFLSNGLTITDMEENDSGKKHLLSICKCRRALQIMAEKYPWHFIDAMYYQDDDKYGRGNPDATTGDVFLQCAIFGEIVYG